MHSPQISILMAVHNGMPYLPLALASLGAGCQAPTVRREAVLIDDVSTDESPGILEAWGDTCGFPVRILQHTVRTGLTRSLAEGLEVCHGRYVARQDADDYSLLGRLATQSAYLDSHPRVVAVGTRYQVIDEAGAFVRHGCQARWFPRLQMRLGRNPVAHGSVMFRRDVAVRVGGYRETFERAQDLDLWLRMARLGTIKVLPGEYYSLREHPGRVSIRHQGQQAAWAQVARWANLPQKHRV